MLVIEEKPHEDKNSNQLLIFNINEKKMHPKLRYFLCGIAMGTADTVPGVSGGTIAFITGIYDDLLRAIKSVNIPFFKHFLRGEFKNAFSLIPWGFCIPLLLGIMTAILSLAHTVTYLMTNHPYMVWAFFFGLVMASVYILFQDLTKAKGNTILGIVFGIIGFIFAVWLTHSNPISLSHSYPVIFFSAFIAICAMILPGISGAFVLVLLGQYQFILQAITELNMPVLIIFLCGCVCGLLSFAHIISACLKRYYKMCLSFLTGILAGSLILLYPFTTKAGSDSTENIYILSLLIFLGIAIPLILHLVSQKKNTTI